MLRQRCSHAAFGIGMVRSHKQTRRAAIDLEEITPNRFLVHNVNAKGVLKGEGTFEGRLFELTTWRREGLLARLRERGFRVRTLVDELGGLPDPPAPPSIGGLGWRPLTSPIEQISNFDLRNLRWHPLTPEVRDGEAGVSVYAGWVLRRRKGRGAGSYYLALAERDGGIGLQSLDETTAILTGYAQAMAFDDRPLVVEQHGDHVRLPDVELPPPHRAVLLRIARRTGAGLEVDRRGWPLAQELFLRLGVRLRVEEAAP